MPSAVSQLLPIYKICAAKNTEKGDFLFKIHHHQKVTVSIDAKYQMTQNMEFFHAPLTIGHTGKAGPGTQDPQAETPGRDPEAGSQTRDPEIRDPGNLRPRHQGPRNRDPGTRGPGTQDPRTGSPTTDTRDRDPESQEQDP